ncbi:MAG: hypothetical protein ACI825_000275 [Planctomycetota bacterium]|jgi:hypothetical protein
MKSIYFILILVMAVGCQNVKYPNKPDNLIPEGKMVEVLTEVYLSNAVRSYNIRIVRDSGYKLDSMLYEKFSIDSLQFAKSHAYYSSDLEVYTAIFEKVKAKMEVMKVDADTLKARYIERRRITDSIRRDSLRAFEMDRLEDSIQVISPERIRAVQSEIDLEY